MKPEKLQTIRERFEHYTSLSFIPPEGVREIFTDFPELLDYINELENMPLVQTVVKQQQALRKIRARLGDFQEPWNDREREIDEIARQALEGESHANV